MAQVTTPNTLGYGRIPTTATPGWAFTEISHTSSVLEKWEGRVGKPHRQDNGKDRQAR
ncbi:hypothetical protein COLO4_00369 [Corchorus olitorius]|uniref:Uncharacterized protein n=1 Tax=Corchorus olitorius TaxID=93759 RepID=A0A1R3L434_9ROSI|nr:hypothetical protein COLO4_00369 [Corchorus olitorius]